MGELADILAGKFLVLDGPDGSGKSTQLALLAEHLAGLGADVDCVRDPGGTAVGEKIRQILLDRQNGAIAPTCETMLFMASRAQLIEERVRPALEAGKVVLSDRFVSATVAYQGASGVDAASVVKVADVAVQGLWPDLTVILDVPVDIGMQRAGAPRQRLKGPRGRIEQPSLFGDRLEARDTTFHDAVRRKFLALCKGGVYPAPVAKVDASGPKEEVAEAIAGVIDRHFRGGAG